MLVTQTELTSFFCKLGRLIKLGHQVRILECSTSVSYVNFSDQHQVLIHNHSVSLTTQDADQHQVLIHSVSLTTQDA